MKICNKCKENKSLDAFYKNKVKPQGVSNNCKDCQKAYNVTHYEKTKGRWKESRSASRAALRKKNQEFLFEYFSTHPCVDCGNSDFRVLEFDHLRDKEAAIAALIGGSLEKLKKEIAKCEVRCRNCHIIVTYERLGNSWRTNFGSIV